MRLKASMTVEAAYIVSILMIGIFQLMKFTYQNHSRTSALCISHMVAENMVHAEPDMDRYFYPDEYLEERAEEWSGGLYGLDGADINLVREGDSISSKLNSELFSSDIELSVYDPEEYMRRVTLLDL